MLYSSRDALLKLYKTTSPQKLTPADCITLYIVQCDAIRCQQYCGDVVLDIFNMAF